LAVLRAFAERHPDLDVRWVGGHRGLESSVLPALGQPFDRLWLRSLRTVDLSVATIADPFRLAASIPQAAAMVGRFRPDVVYTTGGYVSIPVLTAVAALRIPALLWEGNQLPGRSVRATARFVRAIAVSFEATCAVLPGRCFVTGTPIRPLSGIDRAAARAYLGLPGDLPVALIFGGSQAVRRLNEAVADALPLLVERFAVLHLTGETAYADALRRREALPAERRGRYRPYPFLRDDMAMALVAANILVGRAGSSTLAEATALGLPMVVVPYPHAGAHQEANDRELVEAGAAELIRDDDFDGDALLASCAILGDPERLARMATASRRMGRPGAANATAELLLDLAERRPLPDAARIERLARGVA
jgi:UDP-N-acetylglucosamine--N-acetylmuramyl-(pentapeptide) pyrophosphoryl-undecaprenol N-acetylglucosamine transferase